MRWWNVRTMVLLITTLVVFVPLACLKRIDSLRYTSALSVALAVVFLVVIARITIFKLISGSIMMPRLLPEVNDFTSVFKLFIVVPVLVTAYICHYNVYIYIYDNRILITREGDKVVINKLGIDEWALTLIIFCVVNSLLTLVRAFSFAFGGLRAAVQVHDRLLKNLVNAPVQFFDHTPSGRILNRLSSDLYTIDETLPFILNILLANFVGLLGIAIVLSYVQVMFLLLLLPFWYIYNKLQAVNWNEEWVVPQRLLKKRLMSLNQESNAPPRISSCYYEWLVKWCGLDYKSVTWELDSFLSSVHGANLIKEYKNKPCKSKVLRLLIVGT